MQRFWVRLRCGAKVAGCSVILCILIGNITLFYTEKAGLQGFLPENFSNAITADAPFLAVLTPWEAGAQALRVRFVRAEASTEALQDADVTLTLYRVWPSGEVRAVFRYRYSAAWVRAGEYVTLSLPRALTAGAQYRLTMESRAVDSRGALRVSMGTAARSEVVDWYCADTPQPNTPDVTLMYHHFGAATFFGCVALVLVGIAGALWAAEGTLWLLRRWREKNENSGSMCTDGIAERKNYRYLRKKHEANNTVWINKVQIFKSYSSKADAAGEGTGKQEDFKAACRQQKRGGHCGARGFFVLSAAGVLWCAEVLNRGSIHALTLGSAVGNLLLCGGVWLILFALTGHSGTAAALGGVGVLALSAANYVVTGLRGTVLLPQDFAALGTAARVAESYTLAASVPLLLALSLGAALVGLAGCFSVWLYAPQEKTDLPCAAACTPEKRRAGAETGNAARGAGQGEVRLKKCSGAGAEKHNRTRRAGWKKEQTKARSGAKRCAQKIEQGKGTRTVPMARGNAARSEKTAALKNLIRGGAVLAAGAALVWLCAAAPESFGARVDVYRQTAAARENGFLLNFAANVPLMKTARPEGYAPGALAAYLPGTDSAAAGDSVAAKTPAAKGGGADAAEKETPATEGVGADAAERETSAAAVGAERTEAQKHNAALTEKTAPNLLIIMDESFTDPAMLLPLETGGELLPTLRALEKDPAAAVGRTAVPVVGGGTSCSEFEFLTGFSCRIEAAAGAPYLKYGRSALPSIVQRLGAGGWRTAALHLESGENWYRAAAYPNLGFDDIFFRNAAPDAPTLRGFATDAAGYAFARKALAESDTPLFLFNVTIQNHGSYARGWEGGVTLHDWPAACADWKGEAETYLSLLHLADAQLGELLTELAAQPKPVAVLFFGDHWSCFSDERLAALGHDPAAFSDDETFARHATPYVCWSNCGYDFSPMPAETSLNYLAAQFFQTLGLPLNEWQKFLLAGAARWPVFSVSTVCAAEKQSDADRQSTADVQSAESAGCTEQGAASDAALAEYTRRYACLQYNALSDVRHRMDWIFD